MIGLTQLPVQTRRRRETVNSMLRAPTHSRCRDHESRMMRDFPLVVQPFHAFQGGGDDFAPIQIDQAAGIAQAQGFRAG